MDLKETQNNYKETQNDGKKLKQMTTNVQSYHRQKNYKNAKQNNKTIVNRHTNFKDREN